MTGPDAADYLQRMVSNDVEALAPGEACPALLLTAKARVIAPLVVSAARGRRLPRPDRARDSARSCARSCRGCACARSARSSRRSTSRCSSSAASRASRRTGPARGEALDTGIEPTLSDEELELRRIESGVPRWGHEIDDRILPAEAGLDATHVSFSKGCYPGQEPVARLHFRGHPEPRAARPRARRAAGERRASAP